MTESRWWMYVQTVAGDVQAKEIADHVEIDKSNVTRWKQGSRPAVEFVLKFARRYGRPVVEALVEAEYITEEEAAIREVKVGLSDLSSATLAQELSERLNRAHVDPDAPISVDDDADLEYVWSEWLTEQLEERSWSAEALAHMSDGQFRANLVHAWLKGLRPNPELAELVASIMGVEPHVALAAAGYSINARSGAIGDNNGRIA